jgi:hypothetical protein
MKNAVFWDVTSCDSCKYRQLRRVFRVLVTVNVVPSSPILVTFMLETTRSSETTILVRTTSQKTTFLIVTAVKTSNLT